MEFWFGDTLVHVEVRLLAGLVAACVGGFLVGWEFRDWCARKARRRTFRREG